MRSRLIRLSLFGVITLVLVGWAAHQIHASLLYVHETDARIAADMISVSSRVAGWLVERPVDAGSRVAKDELLVVVDGRDAETRLKELLAEVDRIEAEREELAAQIAMVDEQTRSRVRSELAKLDAADALVEAIEHQLDYQQREFQRAELLLESGVISAQTLDGARTEYLKTQKELVRVKAVVATAQAQLTEAEAARHEVNVLESERATLEVRKAEVVARIERQQLAVDDRVIASPVDGVVSRAFVEVGEYVQPGQRILLLHDPQTIYVDANIRETDIRKVALHQHVRVEVDAYPDQVFEGTVERIGYAATSQFALLPSPNPSGNFTKVTQRLPVRIALSQREGLLRPGMMVEVFIDVRDR